METPAPSPSVDSVEIEPPVATPVVARTRRRLPRWAPRMLAESALIVFSVLLALALDQWRDGRRQAADARIALDAIVAELQSNRKAADDAMRFHRSIKTKLEAVSAAREIPSPELAFGGMLQPARVVSTAWTSARDTGALSGLPYALVLQVSLVYERQASYDALAEQLVADLYMDARRRGVDAVFREGYVGFIALTSDFSNREALLVRYYDRALAALGHSPPARTR